MLNEPYQDSYYYYYKFYIIIIFIIKEYSTKNMYLYLLLFKKSFNR